MPEQGGPGPVLRFEISTRDEAEAVEAIRQMYVSVDARFWAVHDGARFGVVGASAGGIAASFLRSSIDYFAVTDPFDYFCPIVLDQGRVVMKHGRDETVVLPGEPFLYPLGIPVGVDAFDIGCRVLQLPAARLASVAEETAGIAPGDLRWDGVLPSRALRA